MYSKTSTAITQDYNHGQQSLSVLNAQSIKNKEILIMDYIIENRIEACIVTETWLSESDDIWISTSDFTKHNYNITVSNRQNRRGGGLALIYKTTQNLQVLKEGATRFFEYAIWKLTVQSTSITIIAVYHPPYSEKKPITNAMFIDDITEFLTEALSQHQNIILAGDFNIHINKQEDPEANILMDTMTTLGLQQHTNFITHCSGNTLDLIFTETITRQEVLKCTPGPFISDRCAVNITLSVPKTNIIRMTTQTCNLKDIDLDSFIKDIGIEDILTSNLEDMVEVFNKKLTTTLDYYAPEKTKRITKRETTPWFTDEVKSMKKQLRRKEQIWHKQRTPQLWFLLKQMRNEYNRLLNRTKINAISTRVSEWKTDTKKLYNLIRYLTRTSTSNPLPPSSSDEEMANEFADYFMNKIQSIRDSLDTSSKYLASPGNILNFSAFEPLSASEVKKSSLG